MGKISYLLIILLAISSNAFALEGTILVLDAPIFGVPDETSKVIQYYRKGDEIYIHPSEAIRDNYQEEIFTKKREEFEMKEDDLLLTKEGTYIPNEKSNFYKTIARSGREAYVLKEHVLIVYKDKREFTQKVIQHDHTDYRLPEPLNRDYPFIVDRGYRSQLQFATGQPNYRAYPFRQNILDTSFNLIKEFNFIFTHKAKNNLLGGRLYFGTKGGIHVSDLEFVLTTQVAKQTNSRFYIGPLLSYDLYRTTTHELNIYTSLHFVIYDTMDIKVHDNATGLGETRTYQSPFSITPNLGGSFNFKKSFFKFDTLLGFNVKGLLPKKYSANDKGDNSEIWNSNSAADSFNQPLRAELSYFISVRSLF
jgi:hypothetical protein